MSLSEVFSNGNAQRRYYRALEAAAICVCVHVCLLVHELGCVFNLLGVGDL